ncbi:hypothetical protein GCM10010361_45120 [Streptomyces olivaceiscleroticus]|uniref:Uncharacterized protein n=1 Tax=Streptomyces olivaceiscleroticus TaxID=68245 RepID=A0ABN1AG53_9ACTN
MGYAYGNKIENGDRYWQRTSPAPDEKYTSQPAVALKEIGVRPAWRGTGEPHGESMTRSSPAVTSST